MALKITTLDGEPVDTKAARFWVPTQGEAGVPCHVIIVEPVTQDIVPAVRDDEDPYGTVRIITPEYGVRTVRGLGLGILIRQVS